MNNSVIILGINHQSTLAFVRCSGEATTKDGSVIIEINSGTGVYASQMGMERGIADKFK